MTSLDQIEQGIADTLQPLRTMKESLEQERDEAKALVATLDANILRVGQVIAAAEPKKAKPKPKKVGEGPSVSEDLLAKVREAVVSSAQPVTARELSEKIGSSDGTVRAALGELRKREEVRSAGVTSGPGRQAQLFASMANGHQ